MTPPEDSQDERTISSAIENFMIHINGLLWKRWDAWAHDHEDRSQHEVIGALLSRQVVLVTELARNFISWNDHIAPLLLRSMVEGIIETAWILQDPTDRAKRFIEFGLGQEKLLLEHEKAKLVESGSDPIDDPAIIEWERWLNAERLMELTEVNVGAWDDVSLRHKAEATGYLDLHRIDYSRWSAATHGMWHHLVKFNLQHCTNPLHGFHRVPATPQLILDPDYLLRAAEYLDVMFELFDEQTGVIVDESSAVEALETELGRVKFPDPNEAVVWG